jgi:hypothetical protein
MEQARGGRSVAEGAIGAAPAGFAAEAERGSDCALMRAFQQPARLFKSSC